MKKALLFRLTVLVAAMMCALGAAAAEAYACYTSSNTTLTFYYDNQRSSRSGTTYDLNTGNYSPGWYTDGTYSNVSEVKFDPSFTNARPTTCHSWFRDMAQLQTIYGLNYMNTSAVTHMVSMFRGCSSLTVLDLSSFSTANVIAMGGMFMGCSNLRTIYAGSGWSTAAVEASAGMFYSCTSLVGGQGTTFNSSHVGIDYAHIDGGPSNPGYFTEKGPEAYACYTSSNTTLTFYYDTQRSSRTGTTYDLNTGYADIGWQTDGTNASVTKVVFDPSFAGARPTITCVWFDGMTNLQSITGMSYLNTSEVTDMSYMFAGCEKLTSVDVSHFNTSKVIYMGRMFDLCTRLTSLDLSSFNTSHVAEMRSMFSNCSNLRTIYVGSGWSTAAVMYSTEMFWNCICLVGGQGTTWNSSNPTDKTYAHIDGGTSNPGYFTDGNGPRPYACYTSSNTTLTFYYDNQRSSRTGTTYDLNTGYGVPLWYNDEITGDVTKVVFDPSFAGARPTSTYGWFYEMENLQSITGIEYLNTSEVTNMGHMFNSCIRLTSLDLSNFNTSKVTHMNQMFQFCYELTSLDLSSFNTAKVTDMHFMLDYCTNLRTIYVGNGWSTAAVTNSTNMFRNCTSLVGGQGTTYDVNHVDATYAHIDGGTSNPGYFTEKGPEAYACYTPSNTTLTFYYDNQRSSRTGTTYDLNTDDNDTDWDTDGTNANVTRVVFDPSFANARPTTTCDWFYGMTNLQSITGMSYLNTSEVIYMNWMFLECSKLTCVDVSHFNTSKVISMYSMFNSCTGLTSLDLSSFNTSKVAVMLRMFYNSTNLRTIYVGNGWSTAAVTHSANMFSNCTSLVGGQGTTYDANHIDKTYAHIDGGPSNPGYFTDGNGPRPYACYTSSNTTLTFYYDNQRSSRTGTTYDLNTGGNDTGWDTDGTKTSVTKVVFDPSFAGARPTTTYDWFYGMQNLESITGMSYLNTSEVTNMAYMFLDCVKLTSLDVSHFNTSKVINMDQLFSSCNRLTSLDLSNFNTANVTDMRAMFYNSTNLRTIYVGSGWSTAAVTSSGYMFTDCASLVGGQGTTYDASHVDKTYAHIDGGTSNPGYFTDKNASLRGDVNGDGSVNISDVTALIDLLLGGGSISNPAADCNQDSSVNISDVTSLIDYLLSGRW